MRISIDSGFLDIKLKLKDLGYEVFNISENISSDAYIFSERDMGMSALNNAIIPREAGALLINGDDKGLEDIVYILNHKLYSPLFNITYKGKTFI